MVKKQNKDEELDKSQAIELALAAIEKVHGKGSVMFGGGKSIPGVEFRSSGCMSLDKALGGGWAKGRIVEIYGPESSGKTTLTLHAVKSVQDTGGTAAFIDMEHAFDPKYATDIGINVDELYISQPESGEEALQIAETFASSGAVDLIVVDSVASLLPKAEIDKEIGESTVGRQAMLMSQALRKLPMKCSNTGTTLLFTNQIRMKIGILFGNPETTPGGNALKYYASQRVDVRRIGGVKEGTDVVANATRVKVVKNKVAPPFKQCEFEIKYGEGINIMGDVIENAVEKGLIKKAGSWYSQGETKLGQGKPKVIEYFKENVEAYQAIWEELTNE